MIWSATRMAGCRQDQVRRQHRLRRAQGKDLAIGPPRLHVSTLRAYQIAIRLFCEYLLDRRYP